MNPTKKDQSASAVVRAVAVTLVGVVILWALYLARHALVIIYISVLLAIGVGPFVHAIEMRMTLPAWRWRPPRWLPILLVYLGIVAALLIVGILVIPPLITQGQDLWTRLPGFIDRGQTFLLDHGLLSHRITLEEAVRRGPGTSSDAVGTVASAVTRVVQSIFALITILMLTFYLLVESESLCAGFARLFPIAERPRVVDVSRQISGKVSAWLSGQLILAGTIGATAAAGLYVLGVPYFYVLALVTAVGETIPVVGPVLSAIPATIAGFSVSPHTGLFVLLFCIVQQQLENHLLVPKVMQMQVGVSPVIIIAALLIGGALLGILGAVLAIPTAAILQVIVQELLDERDRAESHRLKPTA